MSSTQVARCGNKRRDPLAALAVLAERPLGADDPALVLLAAPAERLDRDRLAVERVELGLVVEGVDVAGPPYMNRKMTLLALAGNGGALGASGIDEGRDSVGGDGLPRQEPVRAQQGRQGDRAEAAADLPEKLAPGPAAERAAVDDGLARP